MNGNAVVKPSWKKLCGILLAYLLLSHSYAFTSSEYSEPKIAQSLSVKLKEYNASDCVPVIVTLKRGECVA